MNKKITCALFGHRKMPPWVARELDRTIDLRNGLGTLPTVYPEGLERVPKGLCYPKRNEWMIRQADVVCVYSRVGGGAEKCAALADWLGREVIRIVESAPGNS